MIEIFLSKGANLEAKDKDANTPLMWTSRKGDNDTVEFLLSKGANIEAEDNNGCTSLIWA